MNILFGELTIKDYFFLDKYIKISMSKKMHPSISKEEKKTVRIKLRKKSFSYYRKYNYFKKKQTFLVSHLKKKKI